MWECISAEVALHIGHTGFEVNYVRAELPCLPAVEGTFRVLGERKTCD